MSTNESVELVASVATAISLIGGLGYSIYRFGLNRERFTFLNMSMDARTVQRNESAALVAVTVHLENRGESSIRARVSRDRSGNLYDSEPDICRHAGTLKVRAVPAETKTLLFDWYALEPLRATMRLMPGKERVDSEGDLEQINYLDEFQDPETDFQSTHFWIEPHETYHQTVMLWLSCGIYAAKACFLGERRDHENEEYWSACTVFVA